MRILLTFSVYFLWYYKENLSNNQTLFSWRLFQILFLDEIYPDEKYFWLEFKLFVFKTTKKV